MAASKDGTEPTSNALDKCPDKDSDWDLWNKYILFALRESPNRITGYAPFTLLYGRPIRGPLAVIADSWKEEGEPPSSIRDILTQTRERLAIVHR